MHAARTLETFFHDEVGQALRVEGLTAKPLTEHYVVQLLTEYANQTIDERPLALKMMDALEADPRERRSQLREIGDTSLYVSGFWSESFARRIVDVDYYIGVGESAYSQLARTGVGWARDPFGDVYDDLSHNFVRFVRVLGVVSRRVLPEPTPKDIVRLYEQWTKHKSSWARARLAALGVVVYEEGESPAASDRRGRPQ